MQKKPFQESFYEVHLNTSYEIMISIQAQEKPPMSPVILYDGKEHALLYRTPESSVLLDFLHTDVREPLLKAKTVLIAETKNFKVKREYIATVRSVKSLPLDDQAIKPLLNEENAKNIDDRNLYK